MTRILPVVTTVSNLLSEDIRHIMFIDNSPCNYVLTGVNCCQRQGQQLVLVGRICMDICFASCATVIGSKCISRSLCKGSMTTTV